MSMFDELYRNDKDGGTRMHSVTTGIVVENWHKEHPGKVKVEVFLGESGKNQTDWLRVAQPYAGKGFGSYFLPEVGSEVVLAFNLGERDHPIVIGSLWNQVDAIPEESATEKNSKKYLRTKGGHELIFTEEAGKESLTLRTPAGHGLHIEDENKTVVLQDESAENILQINGKDGTVTISAKSKIILEIGADGGSITLDGKAKQATIKSNNINIEATQNLTLKGQNVTMEGAMLAIKASGNADVNAGGVLNLKGSMTKIN